MACTVTADGLSNFYNGFNNTFRNPLFRSLVYSDGVKYVSDNGGGWLIVDILAHLCHNPKLRNQEFVVAKLKVKDSVAMLTLDDGNGHILARQSYPYTDFTLPEDLVLCGEWRVLLPSER
jgi:hypothetical protein